MKVLILGAGAAGMMCARELEARGLRLTLVEAQKRMGGRCFTLRAGTRVKEDGHPEQTCSFEGDRYFNPGPARIAQHHRTVRLCRELGVGLEPFVNRNYAAFQHTSKGPWKGRRVPLRDLDFDLRGRTYELLYERIEDRTIAPELDEETRGRFLDYCREYGGLGRRGTPSENRYTGADRRTPGSGPASLEALLASGLSSKLQFLDEYDLQHSMLQVVGGTDRLTDALAGSLESEVHLGTVVRSIEVGEDCVSVRVEQGGEIRALRADRCVVALPLPALARVETNLGSDFTKAVREAQYDPAVKVGLEYAERWWEAELDLYGGMTFTDLPATQFWYPSHGLGARGGVLLGAYSFGTNGAEHARMTPAERIEASTAEAREVHGRADPVRSGVTVAWKNMPWAGGAYAGKNHAQTKALKVPHPRVRLAGEHMSDLHGWIAGALESGAEVADWILGSA
ncbi:MAG: FAD-dependent oxidoreductase [Planctomycetota bacterium]